MTEAANARGRERDKERDRDREKERLRDLSLSEYFQAQQINAHLGSALKQLLRAKPADPAAFLADHFRAQVRPPGELVDARRLLKSSQIGSVEFMLQVADIFQRLQTPNSAPSESIDGESYNRFVRMLIVDLPFEVSKILIKKLERLDKDRISFSEFSSSVTCALIYAELGAKAEKLFKGCHLDENGWARKNDLLEVIDYSEGEIKDPEFATMCKDAIKSHGETQIISFREFLSRLLNVSLSMPEQK